MHMTYQDYQDLAAEIAKHNKKYFVEHTPEISDEEFDQLLYKLQHIETLHPEWILADSPTQRIGEETTKGFKSVAHNVPMLSLANTYSKDEVTDFLTRIQKNARHYPCAFSCELKMDGIAISATYENGVFVKGVTRGDGKIGDDITANLMQIASLPRTISDQSFLEIRGEVFMRHAVFSALNQEKEAEGEELWANPRNAAAGSLKLIDQREVAARQLSIVFYGIATEGGLETQSACHDYLKGLGFPILEWHKVCHSLDEIMAFAEEIRKIRETLEYDIDGVVVKLNDLSEQKRLGNTNKHPRWAIAYKFAPLQAKTRILDITVQVGRTGTLTPVAELKAVFLAGSTIARATLHNEDEIGKKDIRVGDVVTIEKGGDVIPKVVSVDFVQRNHNSSPWQMPTHCPSCGSPVLRLEGEVAVRCPNSTGCPAQSLKRLSYFASRPAMDIDHLGEKVMEQLVLKGFVKEPADIFRLKEDQLFQLDGFKKKSVDNLIKSIEKAKDVSLDHFLMALGIRHVGAGTALLLANKFGSIQALMDVGTLTFSDDNPLLKIDGIGEIVSQSVFDYFFNADNRRQIEDLLALGVSPRQREMIVHDNPFFKDKVFVLTGTLHRYTRQAASALIKERGGKITSAVSKSTDFLLAGTEAGSKLDKAKALGIKVLTEDEFIALIS